MKPRCLRFLLVEDDDDHADLIGMELSGAIGADRIARVADGEEALAYLRREGEHASAPRPDLVLLDLKLPKLSGHEVLEAIKGDDGLRVIPVLVMSTSAAGSDRDRAYRSGANGYLVKPVDFDHLQAMIRDLVHYWATWNEGPTSREDRAAA